MTRGSIATFDSIPAFSWDVIVVGAGAAGLMACLELPSDLKVLLLNRNTSRRSSSRWAQGGIAAVTRPEDSIVSHAQDTLHAGAGLCDLDAVEMLVEQAPKCVKRLETLGMEFDRDHDVFATTLEAAHSHRRVLHVQDRTGRALVDVLQDQVESRTNIHHRRGVRVSQLWVESSRCCGVQVLDGPKLYWIAARAVVLATGGGGHLFANTTNPAQSCGEGVALGWNAGAVVEDLEFVQFHPTALKLEGAPCFLISEALRGEGALLVDNNGDSPVSALKGRDLAPRDQVSRALVHAMKLQRVQHMSLDLKNIPNSVAEAHFPTILQRCRELGFDPLNEFIPVAPAAHYWMGGIATNLFAETTLSALYAVGEVACTGLHGANRLASNSLMECLVFASQMAFIDLDAVSVNDANNRKSIEISFSSELNEIGSPESLIRSINDLRQLCWIEAGVDRSVQGMKEALGMIQKDLDQLEEKPILSFIHGLSRGDSFHLNDIDRKYLNLVLDLYHRLITSRLLLKSCLFRCESRGGHFRTDTPSSLPYWQCHSRQKKGMDLFTRSVNI